MKVLIKDESLSGQVITTQEITFDKQLVSVKDIIAKRVEAEVQNYNDKLPEYFNGLVQPTLAEKTLNGYKLRDKKLIDAEKQVYVALDSFLKNEYFVLVDNKQVESLEHEIQLSPNTEVSFLKLTPLVGG